MTGQWGRDSIAAPDAKTRRMGVAEIKVECKKWMESFFKAVDRLGPATFDEVICSADATRASALVRKAFA